MGNLILTATIPNGILRRTNNAIVKKKEARLVNCVFLFSITSFCVLPGSCLENFDCEKINSRILIEESIWLNLDMETTITIKPILHRGEEQLAIFFPLIKTLIML